MSPYIVTTNRGCDDAECNPNCRNRERSRRAFPDGTVIDVEQVDIAWLAGQVDRLLEDGDDVCAAFNAQETRA